MKSEAEIRKKEPCEGQMVGRCRKPREKWRAGEGVSRIGVGSFFKNSSKWCKMVQIQQHEKGPRQESEPQISQMDADGCGWRSRLPRIAGIADPSFGSGQAISFPFRCAPPWGAMSLYYREIGQTEIALARKALAGRAFGAGVIGQ